MIEVWVIACWWWSFNHRSVDLLLEEYAMSVWDASSITWRSGVHVFIQHIQVGGAPSVSLTNNTWEILVAQGFYPILCRCAKLGGMLNQYGYTIGANVSQMTHPLLNAIGEWVDSSRDSISNWSLVLSFSKYVSIVLDMIRLMQLSSAFQGTSRQRTKALHQTVYSREVYIGRCILFHKTLKAVDRHGQLKSDVILWNVYLYVGTTWTCMEISLNKCECKQAPFTKI